MHLKNPTPKAKGNKLNYFSAHVFRSVYLIKTSFIHHSTEKKMFSRGSKIPQAYVSHEVVIHRGNKLVERIVSPWMAGFRFGEFTWNRKIALYKAKQKKKKKKKKIRFEHILQIYWTKGLFFGGKLFYTDRTFYELFKLTPGLNRLAKKTILNKLELACTVDVNTTPVPDFTLKYKRELIGFLNYYYSQTTSVNETIKEVHKFNVIRYYLIHSYRGKCHALGKPVNGQRTWSNAWSSFNSNLILRKFISETKKNLQKNQKEEKINFRLIKKKNAYEQKKIKKVKEKKLIWF